MRAVPATPVLLLILAPARPEQQVPWPISNPQAAIGDPGGNIVPRLIPGEARLISGWALSTPVSRMAMIDARPGC
jgi:hypothetical protein